MSIRKKHPSLRDRYYALQKMYQESFEDIKDLENESSRLYHELHYLHEFISYKGLTEEYRFFKENAHEEYDENCPFPHLTL